MSVRIHPTAIVDPSASLHEDVEVQPYSIIEAGVAIGSGTVIGPHCVIGAGTRMGKNNRTYSGAQIGVAPQDLKHQTDAVGRTVVGDNNIFREFVTVSSGTMYGDPAHDTASETSIGHGCLFMATTHVAHDCRVGNGVIMANNAALAGHVTVEDRVIIGGLTGIHQFCVLGELSFIGGMARINRDVVPYMLVEGSPAHCFGPNTVGLERAGLAYDQIRRIRGVYRLLYRSGLNTTQALERIEQEIEAAPEREKLVAFVRASKRGITK